MSATLDHFEIPVEDLDRLSAFLEAVFGWRAEPSAAAGFGALGYRRLSAGGHPEPGSPTVRVGLFSGSPELLDRAVPVVSLSGESIESCLERVVANGGKVMLAPKAVSSGRFARFTDPEGNGWGLWEPAD